MNKKLVIYCAGGLGNRFASIFNGLYLSEKNLRTPIINWPLDNHCGLDVSKIFDLRHIEVKSHKLHDIYANYENSNWYFNTNYGIVGMNIKKSEHMTHDDNKFCFYSDCLVLKSLVNTGFVNRLQIRSEILSKVRKIIEDNSITKDTIGIHIRETDFSYRNDFSKIDTLIKTAPSNVFLCSDSLEIEQRYKKFGNVVCNVKRDYPKKRINGHWVQPGETSSGLPSMSNIERGESSVFDAFVDMLVLSRTNLQYGLTESTFYKFAQYYKDYYTK